MATMALKMVSVAIFATLLVKTKLVTLGELALAATFELVLVVALLEGVTEPGISRVERVRCDAF
jgi:hypothetical protein